VSLTSNQTVTLSFAEDQPAWVYVYKGALPEQPLRSLGIYEKGDTLTLQAEQDGAEILVLSGKSIEEPVVQYGPFVMNTEEEIQQAVSDFQNPAFLQQLKSGNAA